jgi:hypothetical protein
MIAPAVMIDDTSWLCPVKDASNRIGYDNFLSSLTGCANEFARVISTGAGLPPGSSNSW